MCIWFTVRFCSHSLYLPPYFILSYTICLTPTPPLFSSSPLSLCLSPFSEVFVRGGAGEAESASSCEKPNGFPHPTQLDQTPLLTSVATGYYFTELTNFRWGAVIKWSGMETCSCLLMPQVFISSQCNHSERAARCGGHCDPFFETRSTVCERSSVLEQAAVQKPILTSELPLQRRKRKQSMRKWTALV